VALDKNDYALAAQIFREGLKKFPKDPDMHYGLARAYSPSDRAEMGKSLEAALDENAQHIPSYLLLTDYMVDAED
jgi:hypothetical protein